MTRASDSEREEAVAHLREAAAEGRLDVEELVNRIDAAYAATTREELAPLTADLPAPTGAVFRGTPERRATSFAIFGGDDLKLGGAEPAPGAPMVHVRCVSIFGGTDVMTKRGRAKRRPPGLPPPPPPL